jgi:hypothetical protein
MRPSLITQIPAPVLALTAALILPLAACNKAPEVSATNATPDEVRAKVAAAGGGDVMVKPGRWEGTYIMQDMEMPGMPPQVKDAMKKQMGTARPFVNCVTEEDVKNQKALYTGNNAKNCKYDHFTLGGGKIDAAMACDADGQGGKMAMVMNGTYSGDAYHMDMSAKGEGAGPMNGMTMKMSVDAKRVSACTGAKDEH